MSSTPPPPNLEKDTLSLLSTVSLLHELPEQPNKEKSLDTDRELTELFREINKRPPTLAPLSHNTGFDDQSHEDIIISPEGPSMMNLKNIEEKEQVENILLLIEYSLWEFANGHILPCWTQGATPGCLTVNGKRYARIKSPSIQKRMEISGLSGEKVKALIEESLFQQYIPFTLVQPSGENWRQPRFVLNGQLCEILDTTHVRERIATVPAEADSDLTHSFVPVETVSRPMKWQMHTPTNSTNSLKGMGMELFSSAKEQPLSTFPHDWNDHATKTRQFPTCNHLIAKPPHLNNAPEESSTVLSNEAQILMDEARKKAMSLRGLVVTSCEREQQKKADTSNHLMVPGKIRQSEKMVDRKRLGGARSNALSSGDLLVSGRGQDKNTKDGGSSANEFQRVVKDTQADPHSKIICCGRFRDYKCGPHTHTQVDDFDNIAIQRLERWGYSKPATPPGKTSIPSTVVSAPVTGQVENSQSAQNLSEHVNTEAVKTEVIITEVINTAIEVTNSEINTGDKLTVQDSPTIKSPILNMKQNINDSTKSRDFTLLTQENFVATPVRDSKVIPEVNSTKELQDTKTDKLTSQGHSTIICTSQEDDGNWKTLIDALQTEDGDIKETMLQLAEILAELTPEIISKLIPKVNTQKEVEDVDAGVKSEDEWVMNDDEVEEWELL